MTAPKAHRYYVRSRDGRAIYGFDKLEAATMAALAYGLGAHLVDTMAQAYFPLVQEVRRHAAGSRRADGEGPGGDADGLELAYLPYGGWDTGRFGLDRDLIEGIKKGHIAIAHAFLAKGASANARDAKGGAALHWAAARGAADIAALLLGHGADIGARDSRGQSALDVARAKGHAAVVARLGEAGGT